MSNDHAFNLGKFIPGFDFLQKLATRQPGAPVPAPELGNWVAPTVSVDELERRIKDLKAVQFWLDQNAVAIKATIQALEVQKMTLAALQGMNFNMADMAKAFTLPTGDAAAPATTGTPQKTAWPYAGAPAKPAQPATAASAPPPAEPAATAPAKKPPKRPRPAARKPALKAAAPQSTTRPADPMQWWNALTQQFQHIAANALREAKSAEPTGTTAATQAATKSKTPGASQSSAGGFKGAKKPVAGKKALAKKARR